MNLDFNQLFHLASEISLMTILVILFLTDAISAKTPAQTAHGNPRRWFNCLASTLMIAHIGLTILPMPSAEAFGGMYTTGPAYGIIKSVLALGTMIVLIQSREWLTRPDTAFKEGEFYLLVISTLLGMNMMISANHFLLFFLGLEMASVPMACLVAFDKYRHHSAEAGAKFILTATFSSGVMLFGISMLYALAGSLYFDDVAAAMKPTPLAIAGMVFFFSGLAFKISLVPFHFWTADSYQGAPTTVTAYLSVVSKGAAAFALCAILMKVFGAVVQQWQYMLGVAVVLTITVGNLFAIRQTDLKRFMAFSSISQAGYIVLAIMGNTEMSVWALSYYVLVYVAANLGVFTIIASVEENHGGTVELSSYDGFYKTNPKLSMLFTLCLFSLGGIPPFAGMFSKFFVFMASVKEADILTPHGAIIYATMFVALVNTVISLYYYLLIVKAIYIKANERPLPTYRSAASTRLALAICTVGVIGFGIVSTIYEWIASAAL